MTQDQYGQARGPGNVIHGDPVPEEETDERQTDDTKPMTRFQKVASALRGDGTARAPAAAGAAPPPGPARMGAPRPWPPTCRWTRLTPPPPPRGPPRASLAPRPSRMSRRALLSRRPRGPRKPPSQTPPPAGAPLPRLPLRTTATCGPVRARRPGHSATSATSPTGT